MASAPARCAADGADFLICHDVGFGRVPDLGCFEHRHAQETHESCVRKDLRVPEATSYPRAAHASSWTITKARPRPSTSAGPARSPPPLPLPLERHASPLTLSDVLPPTPSILGAIFGLLAKYKGVSVSVTAIYCFGFDGLILRLRTVRGSSHHAPHSVPGLVPPPDMPRILDTRTPPEHALLLINLAS